MAPVVWNVLVILQWLLIRSSEQACAGSASNVVCPYQCHDHGDCHVNAAKAIGCCDCHIGWGGATCDIPCTKPCLYGSCVFAGHRQLCLCLMGFRGALCSEPGYDMNAIFTLETIHNANSLLHVPVDPERQIQANIQSGSSTCIGNFVCHNGGRCVHGIMGGYRCLCDVSRYTGNFCQYSCPLSCTNGGKCMRLRRNHHASSTAISLPEREAVYRCACAEGYTGQRCERRVRS